ncbi:MAG: radical SAM protein [Candidatus Hodarchaeota archaeon]
MKKIVEINAFKKDFQKVDLRFALVYPNHYRAGMSSLAVHLMYELINDREDSLCERLFMSTHPLSVESRQPLSKFDVVGFSLQYETDYMNVLKILRSSNIPLRSADRRSDNPLVVAGGPCASENPEPLAQFIDVFVVGELESIFDDIMTLLVKPNPKSNLEELANIGGIYIPSLNPELVERVWVKDLDSVYHSIRQIIPQVEKDDSNSPAFGKALLVEASRGCWRGCRFCLIGYQCRPYRERSLGRLNEIIEGGVKYTGVKKVALIGPAISDYSRLEDLCWLVVNSGSELSIPSLRADRVSENIIQALVEGGQKTITLAPEVASTPLVESINKGITQDHVLDSAQTALAGGIENLKLYFIIGLPSETDDDALQIAHLAEEVADLGFTKNSVRLSINPFIPKPHTPFQWFAQQPLEILRRRLKTIKTKLRRDSRIKVEHLDLRWGRIQTALSLGDRRIGDVLESAVIFNGGLGGWRRAFKTHGLRIEDYANRPRSIDDRLPWDFIRVVDSDLLFEEYEKALSYMP